MRRHGIRSFGKGWAALLLVSVALPVAQARQDPPGVAFLPTPTVTAKRVRTPLPGDPAISVYIGVGGTYASLAETRAPDKSFEVCADVASFGLNETVNESAIEDRLFAAADVSASPAWRYFEATTDKVKCVIDIDDASNRMASIKVSTGTRSRVYRAAAGTSRVKCQLAIGPEDVVTVKLLDRRNAPVGHTKIVARPVKADTVVFFAVKAPFCPYRLEQNVNLYPGTVPADWLTGPTGKPNPYAMPPDPDQFTYKGSGPTQGLSVGRNTNFFSAQTMTAPPCRASALKVEHTSDPIWPWAKWPDPATAHRFADEWKAATAADDQSALEAQLSLPYSENIMWWRMAMTGEATTFIGVPYIENRKWSILQYSGAITARILQLAKANGPAGEFWPWATRMAADQMPKIVDGYDRGTVIHVGTAYSVSTRQIEKHTVSMPTYQDTSFSMSIDVAPPASWGFSRLVGIKHLKAWTDPAPPEGRFVPNGVDNLKESLFPIATGVNGFSTRLAKGRQYAVRPAFEPTQAYNTKCPIPPYRVVCVAAAATAAATAGVTADVTARPYFLDVYDDDDGALAFQCRLQVLLDLDVTTQTYVLSERKTHETKGNVKLYRQYGAGWENYLLGADPVNSRRQPDGKYVAQFRGLQPGRYKAVLGEGQPGGVTHQFDVTPGLSMAFTLTQTDTGVAPESIVSGA